MFIAGREAKARGVEPKPLHLFINCLSRYGKARFVEFSQHGSHIIAQVV